MIVFLTVGNIILSFFLVYLLTSKFTVNVLLFHVILNASDSINFFKFIASSFSTFLFIIDWIEIEHDDLDELVESDEPDESDEHEEFDEPDESDESDEPEDVVHNELLEDLQLSADEQEISYKYL